MSGRSALGKNKMLNPHDIVEMFKHCDKIARNPDVKEGTRATARKLHEESHLHMMAVELATKTAEKYAEFKTRYDHLCHLAAIEEDIVKRRGY